MSKQLANGVWVNDKFWPAGSRPPEGVAEQITNPRAWDKSKAFDAELPDDQVVGAPTAEDLALAEAQAASTGQTPPAELTGGADPTGDGVKPAAPAGAAKKAVAKKATTARTAAKKSASTSS